MSMPSPALPAIAPSAQDGGAPLPADAGKGWNRAGADHAGADHAAAGHRGRRRPRIGPSVLRLSLAARLGIVSMLLLPLWVAVFLVVRGEP